MQCSKLSNRQSTVRSPLLLRRPLGRRRLRGLLSRVLLISVCGNRHRVALQDDLAQILPRNLGRKPPSFPGWNLLTLLGRWSAIRNRLGRIPPASVCRLRLVHVLAVRSRLACGVRHLRLAVCSASSLGSESAPATVAPSPGASIGSFVYADRSAVEPGCDLSLAHSARKIHATSALMCGKGEDPLDVVHVGDSLLRICLRHISDEPEPSAPARVTVLDDNLDRLSGSAYDQGRQP